MSFLSINLHKDLVSCDFLCVPGCKLHVEASLIGLRMVANFISNMNLCVWLLGTLKQKYTRWGMALRTHMCAALRKMKQQLDKSIFSFICI